MRIMAARFRNYRLFLKVIFLAGVSCFPLQAQTAEDPAFPAEITGQEKEAPPVRPTDTLEGHHFSANLILSPAFPLGETTAYFTPGLFPLAEFMFHIDIRKGYLGIGLLSGCLLAPFNAGENQETLLTLPLALQLRLASRPDAFSARFPVQLYLELGGGIAFCMSSMTNEEFFPASADTFTGRIFPLVTWNQGAGYFFSPGFSLYLCGNGGLMIIRDLTYFTYNPAIKVVFHF